MTIRVPIIVLVAAIVLSAATAFVLASLTQPASSDAAQGGSSAIVSQLKKINKNTADIGSGVGQAGTVMGFLHDIERHTSGTCQSTNDLAGTFNASDCTTIYSSRPSR